MGAASSLCATTNAQNATIQGRRMTLKRAEEYRRLAQECRATARTLSSEEARNDMLAQVDVWDRLADQQDYGTDLSEGRRLPLSNQ